MHRRLVAAVAAMFASSTAIAAAMNGCRGAERETDAPADDAPSVDGDAALDEAIESRPALDACDFLDSSGARPPHCFEQNDAVLSGCTLEAPCPAPLICWWDPGCESPRGHCTWPPSCGGDCGADGCDQPHFCSCCGNVPLVDPIAPNHGCDADAH